jgi:hypothetical protein
VTRDPIYLFDISTAAEFLCDTPQNFDNLRAILTFFVLLGGGGGAGGYS